MAERFRRLSHSIYECKYHVVFCPKYRYRIFKEGIGDSIVQTKRRDRSPGIECTTRPCASSSINSSEICGIRIHGIPEGQTGTTIIPTV